MFNIIGTETYLQEIARWPKDYRKILEVLQEHGDYTTRQIAKKTLLPITTIHNRIRKLKAEKVIRKFTVELDSAAVDRGFRAYLSCNPAGTSLVGL